MILLGVDSLSQQCEMCVSDSVAYLDYPRRKGDDEERPIVARQPPVRNDPHHQGGTARGNSFTNSPNETLMALVRAPTIPKIATYDMQNPLLPC